LDFDRSALPFHLNAIHATSADLPALHMLHQLDVAALSNWHQPKIHLSIITQRRVASLSRLLHTLSSAQYLGDRVDLRVSVDFHPSEAHKQTLHALHTFDWVHGSKSIVSHVRQDGLVTAVVESWYPASDHDFAVLLEDDISVSPLWYVYAKLVVLTTRYSRGPRNARLAGISLYTPRLMEIQYPRVRLDLHHQYPHSPLVQYQTPCSWGALYMPDTWRAFHRYMALRLARNDSDTFHIPSSQTNGWSESWKKFFFEFMYAQALVLVYPNFPNQTSLATNHLEAGEHIGVGAKSRLSHDPLDYTVPLLADSQLSMLLNLNLQYSISSAPVLDLFAHPSNAEALDAAARSWCHVHRDLFICNGSEEGI
jgi:hypothetical protein